MDRRRSPAASKARPDARREVPEAALAAALLDLGDTGLVLLDPRGRLARLNREARRVLALPEAFRAGAPGSALIRTVVAGDDPLAEGWRVAATEREAILHTAAGEVNVLLRTRRIGKPPWLVVAIRDLSQLRRMHQELRRHERLATLGQLSAGVAHEIRNPLAGIGTSAQVLLGRFEPRDDRARFVRVILEEVERLDRIVKSLLQYARPRAPELEPRTLASCVEHVIQLTSDAIEKGGIEVELDVAPRLPAVYIDPDLVTQVLLNVTLNAIQAMPDGGKLRYEIRRVKRRAPRRGVGRRATDPGRAREAGRSAPRVEDQQVRVLDTGTGIPRGVLGKLFDPFFSTKPGGTGLGLSISQTIMQEHGGTIAIASREGRGSTVLLNFPVEKRHGERRRADADS
jgi:two-component system, NtrC family, sensor histidine kinase HydH